MSPVKPKVWAKKSRDELENKPTTRTNVKMDNSSQVPEQDNKVSKNSPKSWRVIQMKKV